MPWNAAPDYAAYLTRITVGERREVGIIRESA
jgi:hypothetical protein